MIQAHKVPRGPILLGLGLALLLTGCPAKPANDVLAKVNGYKILRSEVDKVYQRQIAGAPQKPPADQEQALRLELLHQLIDLRLYLQQAEKLGIVATDDEIEAKLNQLKAPYTKEEFARKLQETAFTEEDYKQEIRRNLTIEKLLNKEIASRVVISEADIQAFYNEHKSQFNVIEPQYYLANIFVNSQPNPQSPNPADRTRNDTQAREKIKRVHEELERGADFASLATKASEDPDTARNGGDLGATPESQLKNTDAATRDAIAKLKPGQFSEVVPVVNPISHQGIGYRIVKLNGKEAAGQRDLSDPNVQGLIRNQLRTQREQFLRSAYDTVLHNEAEVRNYYAADILKNTGQK
ncbi:MAG TPA: SurA N-terminal domain-containing protein [Candidatus Saccharimonadales bacterium]|nr:SurA N-terminal domain-containing protein [Candidatus Saccharimonadales bacterium]